MPEATWKVGDFFYVPPNLRRVEYYGVFTQHGSVLINRGENDCDFLVCSEHGTTNPIPGCVPLEKTLYSSNLIAFLYAIHASTVGSLPFNRKEWPVTL